MLAPWKNTYDKCSQCIKKQRHHFANKDPVKATVFPVVMCRCDSWTIKKAEYQRTDAFELWCWRRLFRVPWTTRRSNQSFLKEINLNIHWRTDAEAEALILWLPTHWKRPCWERLMA